MGLSWQQVEEIGLPWHQVREMFGNKNAFQARLLREPPAAHSFSLSNDYSRNPYQSHSCYEKTTEPSIEVPPLPQSRCLNHYFSNIKFTFMVAIKTSAIRNLFHFRFLHSTQLKSQYL